MARGVWDTGFGGEAELEPKEAWAMGSGGQQLVLLAGPLLGEPGFLSSGHCWPPAQPCLWELGGGGGWLMGPWLCGAGAGC